MNRINDNMDFFIFMLLNNLANISIIFQIDANIVKKINKYLYYNKKF